MNGIRREARQANRDVLGAIFIWGAVADPFAFRSDDRLTRADVENSISMLHPQRSFQYNGKLVELGLLARFSPASRASHVGDADRIRFGVDSADVFVNELGFGSSCFDSSWLFDQSWHQLFLGDPTQYNDHAQELGERLKISGASFPAPATALKTGLATLFLGEFRVFCDYYMR